MAKQKYWDGSQWVQVAPSMQEFDEHLAESTQQAHLAKNIGLEDAEGNFVSTEVEGAMGELFTNVSRDVDEHSKKKASENTLGHIGINKSLGLYGLQISNGILGVNFSISPGEDEALLIDERRTDTRGQSYVKIYELKVNIDIKTMVKFEARSGSSANAYARIYVNDVPVGTERVIRSYDNVVFSEEIDIKAGDRVQLYGYRRLGVTLDVLYFGIFGDIKIEKLVPSDVIDADIGEVIIP